MTIHDELIFNLTQPNKEGKVPLDEILRTKGINKELIDRVLDDYFSQNNEVNILQKAVAKKLRLDGKPETLKEFKRLFDYVNRRGFHNNLIWQELIVYKKYIDRKNRR